MPINREHPRIRTSAWRDSRITRAQARALAELLPRYRVSDEPNRIDFAKLFPSAEKIVVEIGFGNGAMLLEMALRNPAAGYLGIEIYRSGIGRLLLGLNELQLGNVRVADQDARDVMHDRIMPGSIDEIYVMFPDPWQKARHYKRRLIQPEFARTCADRLVAGGRFYFATDWANYADYCLEVMESVDELDNVANCGFSDRPQRIITKFEERADHDRREVFDLIFEKK